MDQPDPTRLAFDDVVIDFAGRRVLRGGQLQALEPKAFGVLALLVQSPGRVFPRDDILDAVWGHRHVTPGVLNRVMTLLRHALGEDAHTARYLQTLHGVGYRFDLPTGTALPEPAADASAPAATIACEASTPASTPDESPRRRAGDKPRTFLRSLLWALPLLTVLVFAGWKSWPRPLPAPAATPTPVAERSIAVLPLVNASGDPGQQFFSDGLSENLIATLSRFDGLKVIGRTSAFRFRDSKDDSRTIGNKLGAAYLLGGSVQRVNGIVRISATLTRAVDGSTLWAEHYDRPYQDLFALQDEIARAVAGALHARLLSAEDAARQNDRPPSGRIDAYNAYLQGLQSFWRSDYRDAAEHQTEATRIDPDYGAAWAQLAIYQALIGQYESDRGKAQEAFRESRIAVDKALQLAPELGYAHAARGNFLLASEFDWQGALAEFRRAVQLAPDPSPIHGGMSRALAANGLLREATDYRRGFLSVEPLFAFNHFALADLLIAAGRLDEAETSLRTGQTLQRNPSPHPRLLYIALLRGDEKNAADIARQQPPQWRAFNLAMVAQIGSNPAAADATLAQVLGDAELIEANPFAIAQLYALHGDAGKTVEWLERAWARRSTELHHLLYDPLILRFRNDPQLIAFCKKIGLPPPNASEALGFHQIRAQLATKR